MSDTSATLFGAFAGLGVFAWVVGVCEMLGAWQFWPWSFRFGPRWVSRKIGGWAKPVPFTTLELGLTPLLLRARMLDSGDVLFRSDIRWPATAAGPRGTILPFRGRIVWVDDVAHLEVRSPLGPLVFMTCWLAGWTAGALQAGQKNYLVACAFWAVGVAAVVGLLWWSVVTERKRLQVALDLLAKRFGWPSTAGRPESPPN